MSHTANETRKLTGTCYEKQEHALQSGLGFLPTILTSLQSAIWKSKSNQYTRSAQIVVFVTALKENAFVKPDLKATLVNTVSILLVIIGCFVLTTPCFSGHMFQQNKEPLQ